MRYRIEIGTDHLELWRILDGHMRAEREISIRVGPYVLEDAHVTATSRDLEGGGHWPPMRAALSVDVIEDKEPMPPGEIREMKPVAIERIAVALERIANAMRGKQWPDAAEG